MVMYLPRGELDDDGACLSFDFFIFFSILCVYLPRGELDDGAIPRRVPSTNARRSQGVFLRAPEVRLLLARFRAAPGTQSVPVASTNLFHHLTHSLWPSTQSLWPSTQSSLNIYSISRPSTHSL